MNLASYLIKKGENVMNDFKIEIDNFTYQVKRFVKIKGDRERKVFWSVKDLGRHNASGKTNNFISRDQAIEYIASLHPQEEGKG